MENELYFTKKIKKWGGSLVIRFSPDEVNILNLNHNDTVEGKLIVVKPQILINPLNNQKKVTQMPQEQLFEEEEDDEESEEDLEEDSEEDIDSSDIIHEEKGS